MEIPVQFEMEPIAFDVYEIETKHCCLWPNTPKSIINLLNRSAIFFHWFEIKTHTLYIQF